MWRFHVNSSENCVSVENGFNDEDDDNDGEDGDDEAILISSGDEGAVELFELQSKTTTLVLTFRRKLNYLNGPMVSQAVSLEKEYYEHDD